VLIFDASKIKSYWRGGGIILDISLERRCKEYSGFARYKVENIVEISVSRLWWKKLSLRWSIPIVGLVEDCQR
jgi:hypothetical protein